MSKNIVISHNAYSAKTKKGLLLAPHEQKSKWMHIPTDNYNHKSSFQCTPPIINNQHKFKLPKEDDAETTKILLISAHDPKPCECKPKLKTEINQNPFQYNPSHKQPT